MPRLYLSLRNPEAVAERARLAAEMHDIPGAADYTGETLTADSFARLRELSAEWDRMRDTFQETCTACGAEHDAVWVIRRVPAGEMGPWIVYRINGGEWTLPGGGIPLTLDRVPRDARRLTVAEASAWWHRV
jgi:hypothetical protein